MISKPFCIIVFLLYVLVDVRDCAAKASDGMRHFKPMRMKYQPAPSSSSSGGYGSGNNYKTTAAATTAAPTTTAASSYPSSNSMSNYGSGIQSLMNYGSSHNYQPLLVLLVPVPSYSQSNSYTTTTSAPETTTTTASSTTEEYGYEPIGSYK